ncbi:extracellular matrix protein 2 isoform X2 [Triplophysa rosa]|uniref:extracellular matrix protein 2 isoform X2 n=1 Tax=Triplophysa rosa TaxID=992332 RepID=UPI002546191C|nr:extracellular matrix protein 2 isoform X2 [Triplophysa rosa]
MCPLTPRFLYLHDVFTPKVSAMRLYLILALFVCLTSSLAKDQGRPIVQGRRRGVGPKRARKQTVLQQDGTTESNRQAGSVFVGSYRNTEEPKPSYQVAPVNAGKSEHCVFRGITMFDKTVWSPKPCVTCICTSGEVVCDQIKCLALQCHLKFQPIGQCCPICIQPDAPEFSGHSPIPDILAEADNRISQSQLAKKEIQKNDKKERNHKKDAERKRRKKQKKEEAERRRKLKEKAATEKEEAQRRQREKEEEKAAAEERRRRMEEHRRNEEERSRVMEMEQREMLRALEEAAERAREELRGDEAAEEDVVWLRGDVFQMPPKQPTAAPGPPSLPPVQEPTEPDYDESEPAVDEPERVTTLLPPGCTISDVIITCENAKLTGIPPLSIPELKSLNLQGNEIKTIPTGAFNGIPNLEWIDLGKNKISSSGIDPQSFKGLKFLSRLYMDGNLLEQIPAELPSTLQELKVNENNLKELEANSFEGLSSLVTLEMEGNLLSEGNVNPLAFKPLKELTYLRLSRNHFRTIPQGLPASLQELYVENNLIEEISEAVFNETTNINVVVLHHNKLDESKIAPLAWINHRNLESLDLSHNSFYLVPSFLPKSLVHLVLAGNQIERIPAYVFAHMEPGLEYLYLSYNNLDSDGVEPESFFGTFNTMTELCLDHNQLPAIPAGINEMTKLHFLRLNNNKIRHVSEDAICDPMNVDDSHLVALRLENNLLDLRKIPPAAFSCVRSYSSVVLKPQRIK